MIEKAESDKWLVNTFIILIASFIARRSLEFAAIESHYFCNKGFFPTDSWILDNVDKIKGIPCVIVQGRYDVVCPCFTAFALAQRIPEAEFHVVDDAGHSASEPGTAAKLVQAADSLAAKFSSS